MSKCAFIATGLLVLSTAQAVFADGWQAGFERGAPWHILTTGSLKITVVCMEDDNRGKDAGHILFHINNNKNHTGPTVLETANEQISFQISYGKILQKPDPEQFRKITDILAQPETFTLRYAGQDWSFTNGQQMELDCK